MKYEKTFLLLHLDGCLFSVAHDHRYLPSGSSSSLFPEVRGQIMSESNSRIHRKLDLLKIVSSNFIDSVDY